MDLSLECPRQIHPLPARRLPRPDPPMRQTCDMTEPPNPFSREGVAGPPPSQPSVAELPRRTELIRLRRTRHPDVRRRPDSARPTDRYLRRRSLPVARSVPTG